MKLKPIYLYGIVAAIAIITLIVVSQTTNDEKVVGDISNKEMPMDNVHKNLNKGMMDNPTGANVSEEVKHKLDVMKKDVDANPDDTLKIREYADFLAAAHRPDEALVYYQKLLNKDKSRKDIYFAVTFIYYNQKNLTKAEEITKQMSKLFPNDPMVLYNLGAIEATKGNKDKARAHWNELIERYPNDKTTELAKSSLTKL
ncbi:MAG: tetratricopeptide repeat protein [Ignavibacteriaceae bacterium]